MKSNSRTALKAALAICAAALSSSTGLAGPLVIDSFTAAYTTVTAGGNLTTARNNTGFSAAGTAQYGFTSDVSILGGARQVTVRDGHSGALSSGLAAVSIDTALGAAQLWGTATAMDQRIFYGSAIDSAGNGPGTPAALNLGLLLADKFEFDLLKFSNSDPSSFYFGITLISSAGNSSYGFSPSILGTNSISLSSFSGVTQAKLNDVDGITFNFSQRGSSAADGARIGEVRFVTSSVSSVPEGGSLALLPLALGALFAVQFALRRRSNRV